MNEHRDLSAIPAIRISMSQRFDDYRALTFETHVMADCEQAEINERLDKLRNAAERQKAIAHLPTARGILDEKRKGLQKETDKLMAYEAESSVVSSRWKERFETSGRRGPPKEGPQEKADKVRLDGQITSSRATVKQLMEEIAVHERMISDMEKLAGEEADASDRITVGP